MKDERPRKEGASCGTKGIPLPGLRATRLSKALTQRELGDLSGVSRETIYRLEGNRRTAHPRTVRRLAATLSVPLGGLTRAHPLDK
jgi:transcriptional regulator with XRE-family HTH domain